MARNIAESLNILFVFLHSYRSVYNWCLIMNNWDYKSVSIDKIAHFDNGTVFKKRNSQQNIVKEDNHESKR